MYLTTFMCFKLSKNSVGVFKMISGISSHFVICMRLPEVLPAIPSVMFVKFGQLPL